MGFWSFLAPETKSGYFSPTRKSEAEVDAAIEGATAEGIDEVISREVAWQISTVHCCIRLIAEGLAQPRLNLYKPTADQKGREVAIDHPLHKLFLHGPNPRQTTFQFLHQIGMHLAIGDAFVRITRFGQKIIDLTPIDPARVTVMERQDGSVRYKVTGIGEPFDEKDIWHIRSLSWSGAESFKFIEVAANALGLARATEQYGKRLFKNGAMPRAVLNMSSDFELSPDQKRDFSKEWNRHFAGAANAHKTPLLPPGVTLTSVANTADEAQWTESRRYQTEEICRFFNIRPNMVMQTGATSYASVEQEFIAHHKHTLGPLHTAFEQSATKALLTDEEREAGWSFKLNSNALLRGSTAERVAYYNSGRERGWLTANEVRALEDLPRSEDRRPMT